MHLQVKKPAAKKSSGENQSGHATPAIESTRTPAWTSALPIQTKLTINQPGDEYEQEADHVAEQVMRMPAPATGQLHRCACGGIAGPDGECEACKAKRLGLQRKGGSIPHTEAPTSVHQTLSRPGQPLDASTRTFMEPRFGHDFSHVRIHTDSQAAQSATDVNASAYTVGNKVIFGRGQYAPDTPGGNTLIAHELTHVVQQSGWVHPVVQRDSQPATGSTASSGGTTAQSGAGTASARRGQGLEIDVLAAEAADDFLVQAAAQDIGIDIRVRSLEDMIAQLERRTVGGNCISQLTIFNHGHPTVQSVFGEKFKTAAGERSHRSISGFTRAWLFDAANQTNLNRLRSAFCCNARMDWLGCTTAGVDAPGGIRTEEEQRRDPERYAGPHASLYQSTADALAHNADLANAAFGEVNVRSWANATCTTITAANDLVQWRTEGSRVRHYVGRGGGFISYTPQPEANCACDSNTGRAAGQAPTATELSTQADQIREQMLRPTYERARGVLGHQQPARVETDEQRTTRETTERHQTEQAERVGLSIRASILQSSGFASGARPTTPEEALRVIQPWGITLDRLVAAIPTLERSLSGELRGSRAEGELDQQQHELEARLNTTERGTFMSALLRVQREPFWQQHFANHQIYIFPDLTGDNRYRGYTQRGTHLEANGQSQTVFIIHINRASLNQRQTDETTASIIHELSHTVFSETQFDRATTAFRTELAELLADHPNVVALRRNASDQTSARAAHLRRIRQMLYEHSAYAEAEILVHLQQITHMPRSVQEGDTSISSHYYILYAVQHWVEQILRLGLPQGVFNNLMNSIETRTVELYNQRIAAAPASSTQRRQLEISKTQAILTLHLAREEAQNPSSTP